ncbi:MAG: hypothetical protein ACR2NA_10285 [Solirubrobacterales bacterium]
MLEILAYTIVLFVNLAFAWVVLSYAWRKLAEAERRAGKPGEDRRYADQMWSDLRDKRDERKRR